MTMEQNFNPSDLTAKTVQEIKAEQRQEYKLVGTINLPRGMKLYSYNIEKDTLDEVKRTAIETADFESVVNHSKDISINKTKAMYDSKLVYIIAINQKNALRKLVKMFSSVKKLTV